MLCLLALGIPVAFAQEDINKCMQDKECLLMMQQLEKAFRDNSIDIKKLEVMYAKLHLTYENKKNLYTNVKKSMTKKEFTALENAIAESKDWHQAFVGDMDIAIANYDKDELGDLVFAIGDLKEPIEKAYTSAKKIRKLVS